MASHSRHVLSLPGEVRSQVKFRREDLLLVRDRPLRDPLAAEKQRRVKAQGFDPRLLVVEVPDLPVRTENGNLVGPTLLDMLVRGPWRFEALPPAAQQIVIEAVQSAGKSRLPREVIAWSVRGLDTLWPALGQKQRLTPRELDGEDEEPLDHPFLAALVSGGVPYGQNERNARLVRISGQIRNIRRLWRRVRREGAAPSFRRCFPMCRVERPRCSRPSG